MLRIAPDRELPRLSFTIVHLFLILLSVRIQEHLIQQIGTQPQPMMAVMYFISKSTT
jgi:hypothetical protein